MFQDILYWSYNVSIYLHTSVLLQVKIFLLHHQKNWFSNNYNQYLHIFSCTWVTTLSNVLRQRECTMSKCNCKKILELAGKKICRLGNPWLWFSVALNSQWIARENHGLWSVSVSAERQNHLSSFKSYGVVLTSVQIFLLSSTYAIYFQQTSEVPSHERPFVNQI